MGYNYCYGRGVDADQEKGKEYFDNAIALGCMDGYYGLGQIAFDEGRGIMLQQWKIMRWLQKTDGQFILEGDCVVRKQQFLERKYVKGCKNPF